MNEDDFLRSIRRTPTSDGVILGPGDDCAILSPSTKPLLATTDVLTEGVDFILAEVGEYAIGWKAMAVNLSDIAAMGGRPTAALVGLVASPCSNLLELQRGLAECAERYGVPIVGGDTNAWTGGLVVSVTVLGEPIGEPIRRDGAKPGDAIFVTGPLGGSLLGRHMTPVPRLKEVEAILHIATPTGMIDLSDGLAKDWHRVCTESRCGSSFDAAAIPIHADAIERSRRTGRTPLDHAMTDGEDFELAFSVSPGEAELLLVANPCPLWRIGTVTESGYWLDGSGGREPLRPDGWEHRW